MNRFTLTVVTIAILITVSSSFAQLAARWAIVGCNNVGTIYGAQDNNGATISLDNFMFQSQEAKCVALGFPQSMELLRDGSGIVDNKSTPWKTQGNRIYFMGNPAMAFNYKLFGTELTLTNDNKNEALYVEPSAVKRTKEAKEAKEAAARKTKENQKAAAIAARSGTVTDKRDGKTYKTVRIGNQTWMAENLNYQTDNSRCYYNNNSNCEKYGRLYDWDTAKTACPNGWRLPSDKEWDNLVTAVGGKSVAGKALKSATGWNNNGNGTDAVGFSALPGGFHKSDGSFVYVGNAGIWWTATYFGRSAYYRNVNSDDGAVYEAYALKGNGHSVRCVMDD